MSTSVPQPGKILTIEEAKPGETVRITGRIREYEPKTSLAVLEDDTGTIRVDLSAVPPSALERAAVSVGGSVVQVIGEVSHDNVARVRVIRSMEGVNMELYRKSLEMRNRFLRTLV